MFLAKDNLQHINSIAHEGKVLVFGTDANGDIWYTVRQDGFEDTATEGKTQLFGWEDWKRLSLPNMSDDQSVLDREKEEFTSNNGTQYLLRSRYRTHNDSAVAPVQLVSGFGHLYVFRQSRSQTLLVDRFVLDGIQNALVPKLEVRFKRSKQKYQPFKVAKSADQDPGDSLDFRDANGEFFYEPTTEIGLVNQLHQGWFSVVLVPTSEQNKSRWHIFAYNRAIEQVELTSIRASDEGLFDIKDYTLFESDGEDESLKPRRLSGIIKRRIALKDTKVTNGLAATFYYTQSEQQDEKGEKLLLKEAAKVMLVIPTDRGDVAALNFAIAQDGTLSQLDRASFESVERRSNDRDVLLPLDTLDNVKAMGSEPPPQGTIVGISRTDNEQVRLLLTEKPASLNGDRTVKIAGTTHQNGCYPIVAVDPDNPDVFEVQMERPQLGQWEVLPNEESLDFDGIITAFERLESGNLRVTCPNHGLAEGDQVQITGTSSYDGTYPIVGIKDQSFTIDCAWQAGEAVNLKVQSRKRRGVTFSGAGDRVEVSMPNLKVLQAISGETYSAWIWAAQPDQPNQLILDRNEAVTLLLHNNKVMFSVAGEWVETDAPPPQTWAHYAGILTYNSQQNLVTLTLCRDGKPVETKDIRVYGPAWSKKIELGNTYPERWFGFQGKVADVQIWQIARTPKEIEDTMHLQLSGKEVGLAGYWRMGAIAAGTVKDFSVHGNDGIVHGNAFVSAVTLDRTLKDGKPVTEYRNAELFAVTQGATYVEQFEFRIVPSKNNPQPNPRNIDQQNNRIFEFNYWGQRSSSAKERIPLKGTEQHTTIAPLDKDNHNDWYSASCSFTVPSGVTMMRSFELTKVRGDWEAIEIRKHNIRLVSDTITEDRYGYDDGSAIVLAPLSSSAESVELSQLLSIISTLERKEAALLIEQRQLIEKVQLASQDSNSKQAQIKKQDEIVKQLEREEKILQSEFRAAANDPLNFWCRLRCRDRSQGAARIYTKDNQLIHGEVLGDAANYLFKFEKVDDAYLITSEFNGLNLILDMPRDGSKKVYGNPNHHRGDNQKWQITSIPGGYYIIFSKWENYYLSLGSEYNVIGEQLSKSNPKIAEDQKWTIEKIGGITSPQLQEIDTALIQKQRELDQARRSLAELSALLNTSQEQIAKWQKRIDAINALLQSLQLDLASKNTRFLNLVTKAQQGWPMPPVATDSRSLVTTGAILDFVRPHGRINAIETSEGNVQLTYFDNSGKLRQTLYDATADSRNLSSQQWLPDAHRACLNFDKSFSYLEVKPIALGSSWTIEAWFVYPLPDTRSSTIGASEFWNTLIGSDKFQIAVRNGSELGTRVNDRFQNCGYRLDQLTPGWHHLTAVGQSGNEATVMFYINGERVGDTRSIALPPLQAAEADLAKLKANRASAEAIATAERNVEALRQAIEAGSISTTTSLVTHIGNHPRAAKTSKTVEPFGKLAEVRLWQEALNAEEIEINSKTLLSGNEPGLLAYYPLSEAIGVQVRDRSPNQRHGTAPTATWFACAAPIGNLGHWVMPFDGADDAIELPAMAIDFNAGLTIETWVYTHTAQSFGNILELRDGDVYYRHCLYLACSEEHLVFGQSAYLEGLSGGSSVRGDFVIEGQQWTHLAITLNGTQVQLYKNGQFVRSGNLSDAFGNLTLTHNSIAHGTFGHFNGQIAEIRLWNRVRSQAEIQANYTQRLTGNENALIGYWLFDKTGVDAAKMQVRDFSPRQYTGMIAGKEPAVLLRRDQTLPLARAGDALVSTEYVTYGKSPTGEQTAMLRRFFASINDNGVSLLAGKRIELLELRWIGNAQTEPTLLGYIEGAPPVPSENLTASFNYNGATSVELAVAGDVSFSWQRDQDWGLGATASLFIGVDQEVQMSVGVGMSEIHNYLETRSGFLADLSISGSFLNSSTVSTSAGTTVSDRLELRGSPEVKPQFDHLGTRFMPKNIGYALVVSGLADVYVTRLARSKKMISYQVQPVEGTEFDVNTITFLINPAYTLNGSLDGLVGSSAANDRTFRHVPEMRNQYGSLYPASYYRIREAYDLKRQIQEQDAARETYFVNFNSHLLDTTSLGREINTDRADEDNEDQRQALKTRIKDQQRLNHAAGSFEKWQKRMEDIQIKAGKRNIVNTYVWDADGGLRTEAQQFASTITHTIGGSFNMEGALGGTGGFKIGGAGAELTAQATFHMTQTMTKTENRSKGFALNVDLSGVESLGITDTNDIPLLPGEKVDRYRFMSFYQEGDTQHFQDFFNQVVDPEWLHSNDEEARALRSIKRDSPNATWRVRHRVTYVERPALMNFGQDVRKITATTTPTDTKRILDRINQLEQENQQLEHKIDQVLKLLQAQSNANSD